MLRGLEQKKGRSGNMTKLLRALRGMLGIWVLGRHWQDLTRREGCVKNRRHLATQSKMKRQVRSTHQETQTHDGGVTNRTI